MGGDNHHACYFAILAKPPSRVYLLGLAVCFIPFFINFDVGYLFCDVN